MTIQKGSIVYLKTGSVAMTSGATTLSGYITCNWFIENEVKEHSFLEEQLTEINPKSDKQYPIIGETRPKP